MNGQRGYLWDKPQELLQQQYSRGKQILTTVGQERYWQASKQCGNCCLSAKLLTAACLGLQRTPAAFSPLFLLRVTEYSEAYPLLWKATPATFFG